MAFVLPEMSGARSLRFDHKHFAIVRWPRRKAPQLLAVPKENAQGHGGGAAAGVLVGFCGVKTPHFCVERAKIKRKSGRLGASAACGVSRLSAHSPFP